jgi:DNA-binding response OmpR family regulator
MFGGAADVENNRPTILCIDDDVRFLRALVRLLGRQGYVTEACASGEEGLQRFAVRRHDVVLLDWIMPGLDGLGTCRLLREIAPEIGIIMLTAQRSTGSKVAALRTGADDYLTKPFDLAELLARVDALWRRRVRRRRDGGDALDSGAPDEDHRNPMPESGVIASFKLLRREQALIVRGRRIELGRMETQFLSVLHARRGKLVARDTTCELLWGDAGESSQHRLDVLVNRVRAKLGTDAGLLDTVAGSGHRLRITPFGITTRNNLDPRRVS